MKYDIKKTFVLASSGEILEILLLEVGLVSCNTLLCQPFSVTKKNLNHEDIPWLLESQHIIFVP